MSLCEVKCCYSHWWTVCSSHIISYHLLFSWPVFVGLCAAVIMQAINWTRSYQLTWVNYQINLTVHVIRVNLVWSEWFLLLFTYLHSLMGSHFTCHHSLAVLSIFGWIALVNLISLCKWPVYVLVMCPFMACIPRQFLCCGESRVLCHLRCHIWAFH